MQREQGHLQRNTDHQEAERHAQGAVLGHQRDAVAEIGHVQGPGRGVEQPDADHDEGGADGAHDQVLIRRHQRPAALAQGDQDIGRERRDFEEHEQVEGVARDRHPEHPGETQQKGDVEQVDATSRVFLVHALARIGQGHRADGGDDQQHEGVDAVDPVFDPPRCRPAAHFIADRPPFHHLLQQGDGDRERAP